MEFLVIKIAVKVPNAQKIWDISYWFIFNVLSFCLIMCFAKLGGGYKVLLLIYLNMAVLLKEIARKIAYYTNNKG